MSRDNAFNTEASVAESLRSRPLCNLIDGELRTSARKLDVVNPATGAVCAVAPCAGRELLDAAVIAAARAFRPWAAAGMEARRQALRAFSSMLEERTDELAGLIALEQGKPLSGARMEVRRAVDMLERLLELSPGDEVVRQDEQLIVKSIYKPLGVVAAIAPWNMPIALSVPYIAHALLCGNTLILKPSPLAPLAVLRMAEYARAIFPPAVLNVLCGEGELGQWMSEHEGIQKIGFTGSIPTGRQVLRSAAGHLLSCTLELGGNDAAIVLPDADVESIAPAIYAAAFVNAGQTCFAIKRLFVSSAQYARMCGLLSSIAARTIVGDPFNTATQQGPVQNLQLFVHLHRLSAEARAQPGVKILCGGQPTEGTGFFFPPTIVAGAREGMRLVDEEQFGPVLPVLEYRTVDEAVERANATSFGLGASVWSQDIPAAAEIAMRLEAGIVWINRHGGADPQAPFGGIKRSGLGRHWGVEGLRNYMNQTTLVLPNRANSV